MNIALKAANLSLLLLYPVAWVAPLAHAGILPFFRGTELTIFSGIADLWGTDIFLAIIVSLFAVVMPYFKTILLALIQFDLVSGRHWRATLEIAGKLSMADVFLLAMYVVAQPCLGIACYKDAVDVHSSSEPMAHNAPLISPSAGPRNESSPGGVPGSITSPH